MKNLSIIILLALLLLSCSSDEDNNASQVVIRLSNSSNFDFQNIVVNTSTGDVNYENIASGQVSGYKSFEKAYRYAFIELKIDGTIYTLQPIDYSGETPLENGYYTYQIDANNSQEQFEKLNLTLIKE